MARSPFDRRALYENSGAVFPNTVFHFFFAGAGPCPVYSTFTGGTSTGNTITTGADGRAQGFTDPGVLRIEIRDSVGTLLDEIPYYVAIDPDINGSAVTPTPVGGSIIELATPSSSSYMLVNPDASVDYVTTSELKTSLNLGALADLDTITKSLISDFDDADYATAAQGTLADSALQSGDNISELVNDADYIPASQKGAANGVCPLDAGSKIASAYLPAIAITDTFVVNSEASMLALGAAETGDVVVRTDENKTYILAGTDPSELTDWQELLTPTDSVLSVNGQSGAVVLDADDIDDSATTNKFVTSADLSLIADAIQPGDNVSELVNDAGYLTTVGGTTVGNNFLNLTNPSAVTFPRINVDNSVTARSASDYRNDMGLGTAATATLTTSTTDATVGLVLKVGDFNIGNAITLESSVNLNTRTNFGWSMVSSSGLTNGPLSNGTGGLLLVNPVTIFSVTRVFQTFYAFSANNYSREFTRVRIDATTWTDWVELSSHVGPAVSSTPDYNTFTTPGTFLMSGTGASNGPAAAAFMLTVNAGSASTNNDRIVQRATRLAAPWDTWTRVYNGTSWSTWIFNLTNDMITASGNRWGVVPYVDSSGFTHVGQTIRLHAADGSSDTYDWEIAVGNATDGDLVFFRDDGTEVVRYTNSGRIRTAGGGSGSPTYTRTDDIDTGLDLNGSNILSLVTGGTARAAVSNTEILANVPVNFNNDTTKLTTRQNLGITKTVSGQFGFNFFGDAIDGAGLGSFFIADRAYTITAVRYIHTQQSASGHVGTITRDSGTEAPGAGDVICNPDVATGAVNTVQTFTGGALSNTTLAAGDRLSFDSDSTGLGTVYPFGVVVTVTLVEA